MLALKVIFMKNQNTGGLYTEGLTVCNCYNIYIYVYIYSMINNPFCFKNIRASILLFNVHDDSEMLHVNFHVVTRYY